MSISVADIFEEYVESLQNLPSEIDQNMHELRSMDEEFQRIRETYTKHRRSYTKLLKLSSAASPTTPLPSSQTVNPANTTASRLQLEKDYRAAVQKQDQKIELALRMYDLVSRHIERIDSQMAKSGVTEGDWIVNGGSNPSTNRKGPTNTWDESWRSDGSRKRSLPANGPSALRKRTHHSSRPNPSIGHNGAMAELDIDPNEPRYCYCNQVSFGDMVACDGENCEKEWFHYACVGLVEPPAGKWFCSECLAAEDGYRKKLKRFSEELA
ncbi:hypothetical protein J3Q64DRAFT_1725028 [Phycomyces blakesleeanus]|uniref:Chromatin modification-related protein n=2 Tax=Phycomyces blakesleeanus TaxID=4837 RepID=A0A167R1E4_PHYB8|nr:hypothetical protein PHYBLDRAFT_120533 [Phycomyces blakesleeanus NRRL 1555(-)]OAD80628.1 hypothetical protein PHYBLDRAFT_120533 [Phycomyces blakesleeanus NRRL 1555(-)]|eukprot:XP_018298668.1 hypothetical protein PHYBLDRAFT_120533 [Phycomyces blakesleeanus NRRL 1555(-)]